MAGLTRMDDEIQALALALDGLPPAGKATVFGLCGRVLAPYVADVERRYPDQCLFPDFLPALEATEAFALDAAPAADHEALRARLLASVPHGHDLDHPLSTYVQDAMICADAGLAAASVDTEPRSIWIEYALEPLIASVQIRDMESVQRVGCNSWLCGLPQDPAMAPALRFLHRCNLRILSGGRLSRREFEEMVLEGKVLLPVSVDGVTRGEDGRLRPRHHRRDPDRDRPVPDPGTTPGVDLCAG